MSSIVAIKGFNDMKTDQQSTALPVCKAKAMLELSLGFM